MAMARPGRMRGALLAVVALGMSSGLVACTPPLGDSRIGDVKSPPNQIITLTSGAFRDGEPIPAKYTCTGERYEMSPPLAWSGVPEDAEGLVLVVDNPDDPYSEDSTARWIAALDPSATSLESGVSEPWRTGGSRARKGELFSVETLDGAGYVGTCPADVKQRLRFTIYALSEPLAEDQGKVTLETLWHVQDHWIASGRLTGIIPAKP